MGNEFQTIIDNDNLVEARNNLNEFTGKLYKRRYEREIEDMDNKRLDEIHMNFLCDNNISFEDMKIVKMVFDYIKSDK